MDTGVEVDHPDLRAFHTAGGNLVFDGGNFREHMSRDVDDLNCSVDERDPFDNPAPGTSSGHGSHVTGIVAATTNNQGPAPAAKSAAGVCWHCSTVMARVFGGGAPTFAFLEPRAAGLDFLARRAGAQAVSLSFEVSGPNGLAFDCGQIPEAELFCDAIDLAEGRDILMAAASGNRRFNTIQFPARDSRIVAVGGVQQESGPGCPLARWSQCPGVTSGFMCGSNSGLEQDLVAPAMRVLSTVYTGFDHSNLPLVLCGDKQFDGITPGAEDGFGPCTGTSMSAPFIAGLAGILRSINPLLPKDDVRDVMNSTASQAASHDSILGFGFPDAEAAVRRGLGVIRGETMPNRLTPLFSLWSPLEQVHAYTTVPTFATNLILDDPEPFDSEPFTPRVPGYDFFPGFGGPGEPPCAATDCQPRASLFVFTTEAAPFEGAPPLVPLYRMRYDTAITPACPSPPQTSASTNRDFALATSPAEVLFMAEDVVDGSGIGYHLDGIDGYLYAACPGDTCQLPGTVRVLRRYHATRRDFAIFAEPDAAQFSGYAAYPDPALPEVIGYAYPNVDSDLDDLIDGWERLLAIGILTPDSDSDGVTDGDEVHIYQGTDPNPALHGFRDPCSNSCPIFADDFESGDTSQWSITE